MAIEKQQKSHTWWFDSHKGPARSPWLVSTISVLEEKIKEMLKLIDEDADSFKKCIDMYYKRRPELINMIEELYRSHRALAESYDQLKRTSPNSEQTENLLQDSYSEYSIIGSEEQSEIEDPEEEEEVKESEDSCEVEAMEREIEIERLREENRVLGGELEVKGENGRMGKWIKESNVWGLLFDQRKMIKGILYMKFFGGYF